MIPTAANCTFNQFETPIGTGSFRAHRFSETYQGLNGVTFNNTGVIEDVNSISENCSNLLSVNNSYFTNLSVYPNPTKDVLNFRFDKRIDKIQVYNLSGKIVLSETDSEFINLEYLSNGFYLIKISADENSEYIKVMKN